MTTGVIQPTTHSGGHTDSRYRISTWRTCWHKTLDLLPPTWRESFAERFLRRSRAPGPALEHAFQYRLSVDRQDHTNRLQREATVAKGADGFYEKQYRQYLNAIMGAFAATATQVVLASGTPLHGRLHTRHRRTVAAIVEQTGEATPIVVLDRQTVAVAIYLPILRRTEDAGAVESWLKGTDAIPPYFQKLIEGYPNVACDSGPTARLRHADGSVLEVVRAVVRLRRLALLALHPFDPDAMGLHISLFDLEAMTADDLEAAYGLDRDYLLGYRQRADAINRQLFFLVGATEEVFTQCSQNLFIKRPPPEHMVPLIHTATPFRWHPELPLLLLVNKQFELFHVTVSAGGLPGASPRNGAIGKAGFVAYENDLLHVLVPYFPGNAIHGHAAKLVSNPYASVIISDDHHSLTRVTLSGPCHTETQTTVLKRFPNIAEQIGSLSNRHGKPIHEPEYWFVLKVDEIVQELEPLLAHSLDPSRPTCSISSGGQAMHSKKPTYFAADTLPGYNQRLQHKRERKPLPIDPSGASHRTWQDEVHATLKARNEHLLMLQKEHKQASLDKATTQGNATLPTSCEAACEVGTSPFLDHEQISCTHVEGSPVDATPQ